MLSFKQILDGHKAGPQKQGQQNICLFTRLKRSIINKSISESNSPINQQHQKSIDEIMKEHQLEFQILKLEKANFIVSLHQSTGRPVHEIMKEVIDGLTQQIQSIIYKKPSFLKDTKTTDHLESTFGNTLEEHSFGKEEGNSGERKQNLTPKIIQFTLGNRQHSSQRTNIYQNNGDEVSQFFINSKGLVSKNIREKVMGQKRLK